MHRCVRRRGPAALAVVAALAAAVLPGQPAALADSSGPDTGPDTAPAPTPARQPAPAIDLDGVSHTTHTVTLVTGDTVTLSPVGDRFGVHTRTATRQDGTSPVLMRQLGPDGLYVLPGDALAAVQAGRLDRELFNITYLVEHGYADEAAGTLPVIVQYPKARAAASVMSAAEALPASTPTLRLESIHAAALGVAKGEAGQFWASLRGRQDADGQFSDGAALGSGVARVWLDRKVEADLADSVPLVGAPQAWAAGYDGAGVKVAILDSGIDETHPDLAGKVVQSRSFVPGVASVRDGGGHGTHVASTVAGSGAASGGTYRGVAPGAELMIGKVLRDSGSGQDSWVIEGMEWAATNGAKIVSMSLGGGPTDGTDPASQAVNELTASTGALFVIAAGNAGQPESVASPGAADAALTVAATDKSDELARFSSRGPRLDGVLKPDIAAPGKDIVAARADGTALGPVVDERYTSISGTSMATPHVSGAAAILAQRHPDWTSGQLKAALMSTSRDVGHSVYEVGAGRLDVARATSQQVFATTANVDFGHVVRTDGAVSRRVTYTNLSDQDVTVTLAATLSGRDGSAGEALRVDQPTLTVPAHGNATATATLDPAGLALGTYSGAVTATADGVALTTPVGVDNQAPKVDLTVHTIGRDGNPITPFAQETIDVTGPLGRLGPTRLVDANTTTTRVPVGTVSVALWVRWVDEESRDNLAYLIEPELAVTGDTEITLDTRTASQVTFDTPAPAEPLNNYFDAYYLRTATDGATWGTELFFTEPVGASGRLWAASTRRVSKGSFRFATQWTLGKSEVDISVVRPRREVLHPEALHHWHQTATDTLDNSGNPDYRFFTGTQDLRVVGVGLGAPEDVAGLDLRGRLALVEADLAPTLSGPACGVQIERIEVLREAGAAGLVFFPRPGTTCPIPMNVLQKPFSGQPRPIGIPIAFLSTAEGTALRDRAAVGPVTLRVTGTPQTPYTYVLKPYEDGRIPGSLHYRFGAKDLARVDLDIHAPEPTRMTEYQYVWKQDDPFGISAIGLSVSGWAFHAPRTRTEWIGPLDPQVLHQRGVWQTSTGRTDRKLDVYDRPVHLRQRWFAGPVTPGPITAPSAAYAVVDPDTPQGAAGLMSECVLCRQGDSLWPFFVMARGSGDDRHDEQMAAYPNFRLHLDKDGVPAAGENVPGLGQLTFAVDDSPGTYRLTGTAPATAMNPQTDITWTWPAGPAEEENVAPGYVCAGYFFRGSTEPCHPEPLVYVSYDLTGSLARDNTVPAGRTHVFTVDAYRARSLAAMPDIAGLALWTSTDDGAHWVPARVRRNHDGTFTARATYPTYERTTGAVSLRVEAWDSAGGRVEQTTMRAVALRDTGHWGRNRPH